ncbi:MAG: hypothetical protein IH788_05830, partial [Nitrospinae bacterium]|nr:hypothetical protein [Nitrospinota bacterium]
RSGRTRDSSRGRRGRAATNSHSQSDVHAQAYIHSETRSSRDARRRGGIN